jgi:arsenate reductase-like glutaredoxin family protein
MKAREFLAHKKGEGNFALRNLIKEPLNLDELRALAKQVGGAEHLVAPKRRSEAEGLSGDKLLQWLAKDGGNVRRPIIVAGKKITLGFAKDAQEQLKDL